MNIVRKIIVFLLIFSFLFTMGISVAGCTETEKNNEISYQEPVNENPNEDPKEEEKKETADIIKNISPKQNGEIRLDNSTVKDFFENYRYNYGVTFAGSEDKYYMQDLVLSWECDNAKYYEVYLDTTPKFQNAIKKVTIVNSVSFENALPETNYYWKVKVCNNDGEFAFSKVYTFKTRAYIRAIKVDGVSNSRDLGGFVGYNGRLMKYGLVYRSANLDEITEKGKLQLRKLGIKTELDLRGPGLTASPIGSDINLLIENAPYYCGGTTGIEPLTGDTVNAQYIEAFKNELKYFADINNYPIIFHCQVGRDRTGTLALMLKAICGVSKDDIIKDYEFSYLSVAGFLDGATVMFSYVDKLCNYIGTFSGSTFRQKAINYCLSIGVTQAEINNIQANLLENN